MQRNLTTPRQKCMDCRCFQRPYPWGQFRCIFSLSPVVDEKGGVICGCYVDCPEGIDAPAMALYRELIGKYPPPKKEDQ